MRDITPWFGLTSTEGASREAVVLGCPFESGHARRGGAAGAPAAIREWTTTAEAVTEDGTPVEDLRVEDLGDVEAGSGARSGPGSGAGSGAGSGDDSGDESGGDSRDDSGEGRWKAIEQAARRAWDEHPEAFLLALGGDHSVTPALAGVARERNRERNWTRNRERSRERNEDLAVVVLDAHPDAFDTYQDDPLSHACVLPRLWDRCGFTPDDTCVAGVRSFAPEELEPLGGCALVVHARLWHRRSSTWLAEEIVAATAGRPVYLSVDVDVLDPSCAPGTGYPVAGGPTTRDLLKLLEEIWERQAVVAMDLVEVAPALDPGDVTVATAAHLCLQALGHAARGRW